MRGRNGVNLNVRGGGEGLGRAEVGEPVILIYCMKEINVQ